MTKTEVFRLRIDTETKKMLEKLAQESNKSRSFVVRQLIQAANNPPPHTEELQANDGQSN